MGGVIRLTKILLIISLASLAITLAFYSLKIKPDTKDILQMFGLGDFEIVEKAESDVSGIRFARFTADNGPVAIKIEHAKDVGLAQARQYIDEKRFGIDSLYLSVPAPYPDVITRAVECPDEFKPIFNKTERASQESLYYVLYANERFTYGVCSDDLIKYRAIFYVVYCEQRNEIYQIELFTAPEEFSGDLVNALQSFEC